MSEKTIDQTSHVHPRKAPRTSASAVPVAPPIGAARLLALQRSVGNRAVTSAVASRSNTAAATQATPVVQRDYELTMAGGAVYESEAFGAEGTRERVSYAEVPVKVADTAGRAAAPPPLSQFADGGNTSVKGTERKAGYDGGHVIGLQVGGHDVPENVVPMYRAFNRGVYKTAEDAIRKEAEARPDARLWLVAYCHYSDDTTDTPYALELILESRPRGGSATTVTSRFLRQPEDIVVVPAPDAARVKLLTGDEGGRALAVAGTAASLRKADASFFDLPKGQTAAQVVATTGHLPRSMKGAYPDDPGKRPYELLDLLTFSGRHDPGTTLSPIREFTSHQRRLVLETNMARNGGVLKSDDPADPVHQNPQFQGRLDERGDVNFPEVDHIVPKSSGGGNFFSNARLVSWLLNNRLDRVKTLHGLVDPKRRQLPALTGSGAKQLAVVAVEYAAREGEQGKTFTTKDVWAWAVKSFSAFNGMRLTPTRHTRLDQALTDLVPAQLRRDGAKGPFSVAPAPKAEAMDTT